MRRMSRRAGLVVDDAGGHEQAGLEDGVVDDVEHPRHRRQGCADAEQRGDQAQVADGGIGQQTLQVVLEQGGDGADEQRQQCQYAAHQHGPVMGTRQGREQARQQEHAGLHHGGRMQVGGNRRRRRHGVGQPEVEGKLGRLGEGAQQDQDQGRAVQRIVARIRSPEARITERS
jgi:hypothetical protein